MDDLPTESNGAEAPQTNPLMATLEAMERLKAKNEILEETVKNMGIVVAAQQVRCKNLEDAFEVACKDVDGPLRDFFDGLKAKEDDSTEEEIEVKEEAEEPEARIGEPETSD